MLKNKIKKHFKIVLNKNQSCYTDSFNFDILNFLCLENVEDENIYDTFFITFENLIEIEKWIDLVKSKIVMHEDEDEIDNIISEYVDLQRTNHKSLCLN